MKIIRKSAFFAGLAGLLALVSACGPSNRDEENRSSGAGSPDPQVILEKQLAEIASRYPDARSAPSGLRFIQIEPGEGQSTPRAGDTATLHYTGRLLNGRVFDSSRNRGRPFTFQVGLGQVIRGWDEAVLDMRKGEKRTLIIPSALGYGARGAGSIPPNAILVFDVELLDFK